MSVFDDTSVSLSQCWISLLHILCTALSTRLLAGGNPFYRRLWSRSAFCRAPMLNASDRNLPRFSTARRLSCTPSYSTLQHRGLCCSSPSQARSNTTASASSPLPRFHSPHYKSDRGDCWISLTLILSTIFPTFLFLQLCPISLRGALPISAAPCETPKLSLLGDGINR